MQRINKLLVWLLLMLIISGCIDQTAEQSLTIITSSGKVKLETEIVDDPQERQRGLMFRENLEENSSMLFVFDLEMPLSFWMKNTLIPLDMIFVSENGTINEIKENVQPCNKDPCPSYPSNHASKYVLEVNGGFSQKNKIKIGDKIDITTLKD
jgi:hypothetical protein